MSNQRTDLKTIASVAQLLAVVLLVAALHFARDVFIPLALGLLLSFLLSPVVNRLHRLGIPNVFAVVVTATLAFVLLAGGFTILGRELSTFLSELPQHKGELITKARSVAGLTSGMGGSLDELAVEVTKAMEESATEEPAEAALEKAAPEDSDAQASELSGAEFSGAEFEGVGATELQRTDSELTDPVGPEQPDNPFRQWASKLFPAKRVAELEKTHDGQTPKTPLYIQTVEKELPIATWAATAGTILGPLATAGLVSVFALFMLIHREDLRDRIIAAVSHGDYVTTTEALDEVARRISRYLVAQTIINTSYGFVLTLGLMLIGQLMTTGGSFPNAILWGVLATCLRYVPYIGPFASAMFPLAIALSVFPGYGVFFAVLALIILMELISNNIIEPWLYGTSTGISAVAVVVAAVFWGWLWGPVGLLLSTPLTVCLVVLGRHVPRFQILTTLFSEEVQIRPSLRFYQRLLAGDRLPSKELLNEYSQKKNLDALCDEVLIPALKRIRVDHDTGALQDESYDDIMNSIDSLIGEVQWNEITHSEDSDSEELSTVSAPMSLVVGCASHHASERIVLKVLQQATKRRSHLKTIDEDTMPETIGKTIASLDPRVTVIMVLPTGGFAQARFLCKRIRREGYSGAIIVACMGNFKYFDRLFVKLRKAGATHMTTSFKQTRSKIESIVSQHVDDQSLTTSDVG